jgi:predicted nucleic acid-binding protein
LLLGPGEDESIRLSIELDAAWLLVDDLDARRAAESCFAVARVGTGTKGTLGILVSAFREGRTPLARVLAVLSAIRARPDIWIHPGLCDRVIALLAGSSS